MKASKIKVRAVRRSIIPFHGGTKGQNRGIIWQALELSDLREGKNRRDKPTSRPSQGAETWF